MLRRALISLGVFALVVISLETALFFGFWKPHIDGEDRSFLAHRNELMSARTFDVLVLGDSTAGNGFIPKLFTQFTGNTAYNWSETATVSSFSDIYYLTEYLKRHPAPKAVIVIRSLTSWPRPLVMDALRERFLDLGVVRFLFEKRQLGAERVLQLLFAKMLPTYRFKHDLYRTWAEPAISPAAPVNYEDGYVRLDGTLELQEVADKDFALIADAKTPDGFAFDPMQLSLTEYLCRLAVERNFVLFVTTGPYTEAWENDATVQAYRAQIGGTLNAMFASTKHCFMIEDHRLYPNRALANATHLNNTGATLFTRQLANEYLSAMELVGRSK